LAETQLIFCREQRQDAIENPIAAGAAVAGGAAPQSNIENLLDIDFDGAVPASLEGQTSSGIEDLMSGGSASQAAASAGPSGGNNMDDLMGIFGGSGGAAQVATPTDDLLNGFGGLSMESAPQHHHAPTAGNQQRAGAQNDLLDLL
jgi:AP-1 complex subunit beta-1